MSTIVCKNLISCFESPQVTETTTTTTLRLKVELCRSDDRLEFGEWGFHETYCNQSVDKDFCFTHNSPYSRLSPASLQLCTENLGSETGSDTLSDCSSIFSASPPLSPSSNSAQDQKRLVFDHWKQKKTTPTNARRKINNFPPPLTTMTGSTSLQVLRHREGGRLIIEAVEAPFRNSYLQAERSDGRLKLCFTTATSSDDEEEGNGTEGAVEEQIEEPTNEFESEKDEIDGEINLMEKFQRLSRCKEGGHGNKGLCSSWKPTLWVATS